jgi:hypothetical protein
MLIYFMYDEVGWWGGAEAGMERADSSSRLLDFAKSLT